MECLTPSAATAHFRDGSVVRLGRHQAEALYLAHRGVFGRPSSPFFARDEFEATRQIQIHRWLHEHEQADRERVLLIGDSIRMRASNSTGYALHTYRRLIEHFNVTHLPYNTGNSSSVLKRLNQQIECRPDIVHFNAGLHDLAREPGTLRPSSMHRPIDVYQANLREIVRCLRAAGVGVLIWASSTPIHDEWHSAGVDVETGPSRGVVRLNADVIRYNHAAAEVMRESDVPINDLYARVMEEGLERCVLADGVHLSHHGARILGAQVAETIIDASGVREASA